MFQKEEFVVHGLKGVCLIKDISRLDFVQNKDLYYTLVPIYDHQTLLYVPVDSEKSKLRKILDQKEARLWLDELPRKGTVWYADDKERRQAMERAMISGDQNQWASIVNGLYHKKLQKAQSGKRFTDRERELYRNARGVLLGELAAVLNSTPERLEEQILEKMEEKIQVQVS